MPSGSSCCWPGVEHRPWTAPTRIAPEGERSLHSRRDRLKHARGGHTVTAHHMFIVITDNSYPRT